KDFEPITIRKQDIEQDQIVIIDRALIQGRVAITGDIDGISMFAQSFRDHLCHARLVFNQQDSHFAIRWFLKWRVIWAIGAGNSLLRDARQMHRSTLPRVISSDLEQLE